MLSDFDGFIEVTHETTRLRGRGRAFDTRLAAIEVTTPRPASHTRVLLAGAAPAERMLRFVRETRRGTPCRSFRTPGAPLATWRSTSTSRCLCKAKG